MTKEVLDCITNPIMNRIIQSVNELGLCTTKQLASTHVDIPQATLYRYIKKLVDVGILSIVEERKVRNVTEKIYELSLDYNDSVMELITDADSAGDNYLNLFQQFSLSVTKEFALYAKRPGIDILNDGSGFRISPFYATTDELKEMSRKIQDIIIEYSKQPKQEGRKYRNVAIIYTPPRDIDEEQNMEEIKNFLDDKGRVKIWPSKVAKKKAVLQYIAGKFQLGQEYTEKEVNALIDMWHTFEDRFILRRGMVDMRFLERTKDGAVYVRVLADKQP